MWPCERTRHTEYLKIGNVRQGVDFRGVWQKLADWVALTQEECPDCWCLHGCQVSCFATAAGGEKPTQEQKRAACQRYRERLHRDLVEYCTLLEENPHALDYLEEITVS
jgi:radical SAM protein with 4Fe4S-binding SPASM domain